MKTLTVVFLKSLTKNNYQAFERMYVTSEINRHCRDQKLETEQGESAEPY